MRCGNARPASPSRAISFLIGRRSLQPGAQALLRLALGPQRSQEDVQQQENISAAVRFQVLLVDELAANALDLTLQPTSVSTCPGTRHVRLRRAGTQWRALGGDVSVPFTRAGVGRPAYLWAGRW
jgi:hypothetical protein